MRGVAKTEHGTQLQTMTVMNAGIVKKMPLMFLIMKRGVNKQTRFFYGKMSRMNIPRGKREHRPRTPNLSVEGLRHYVKGTFIIPAGAFAE